MAVNKLNPSASGIPYGNNAGRPANPSIGKPYFNGELQRLELYTGSTYGWQNIVAETPGVTGYTGSVIETNSTNTITITGTNFAGGAVATLVGQDGTEYNATSTTVANLTSITAVFGAIPQNNEPYDIRVTNPSNLYGVYYDILSVNDKPVWTTAAGSLGTCYAGISFSTQLAATDEENNSLTYSLSSGSLPTGLSLSSSGLISGIPSGLTAQTFTFTVNVSDSNNTAQSRIFSIVYTIPVISGGTLSSDSTYYYRTFTANGTLSISNSSLSLDSVLIAGGGGGGGGSAGGGGGAGGLLYTAVSPISAGSYPIVIGAGGLGKSGQSGPGSGGDWGDNGANTTFNGLTAIGGGGGGGEDSTRRAGRDGGSGGGTCYASGFSPGLGTSGQGFNGGYGNTGYWAGGGGGAGAAGGNSSYGTSTGGNGGSGSNSYSSWLTGISSAMTGVTGWSTATSTGYIAGGGGGAKQANTGSAGSGGAGGGGAGADDNNTGSGPSTGGISGTANTGGGGGGNPEGVLRANQGNGGSGLVIIRYAKSAVGG